MLELFLDQKIRRDRFGSPKPSDAFATGYQCDSPVSFGVDVFPLAFKEKILVLRRDVCFYGIQTYISVFYCMIFLDKCPSKETMLTYIEPLIFGEWK